MQVEVVVIGGGAAGLFCAINAGKRGRRTLVIEHNAEVGRKIIISGGGRCNFTNIHTRPENFVSANPHFARSALARYTPDDFVELVRRHHIPYYEKKLGQLFCRDTSRRIVDMLLAECRAARVRIETSCTVTGVSGSGPFEIETSKGKYTAGALVIAAGGLSFPKIGATDIGYRIARQYGLKIKPTRPSLVPLVLTESVANSNLAGVSLDASVSAGGHTFRENILFTHRGLSGPAILQASNYWDANDPVEIDLLPDLDAASLLLAQRSSRKKLSNFLSAHLPARFASAFVEKHFADKPLDQMSTRELEMAGEMIDRLRVEFRETEGWHKAEVTLGGVSTDELSSKTMESRRGPGLYFIGEVVDVTGWLGGYNFQWAWSSGFAAGIAI
ncbi:MAG TPA: NAD(P)/FAD-dependent oxidoreductase [Pyrinomonadaceae bacterium]|nr:NAD(P)/FAD-dependent oxidoreductase [Pyrinomonadaceae bacterium]